MRSSSRVLLLSIALVACAEQVAEQAAFEHSDVVQQSLRAAQTAAGDLSNETAVSADREQVLALVEMLANSSGQLRALALEEAASIGDGAVNELASIASSPNRTNGERNAACELLGEIGTQHANEHLMLLVETLPESEIRAQAAWRLCQADADELVPRLILRLKYEADHETAIWLSSALAAQENYSGLSVLWRLQREAETEEMRALAAERQDAIATNAGLETAEQHWRLWFVADPDGRLRIQAPSAHLKLLAWELIEQLSSAHFQLRGVDDARYVLARLGPWAIEPLCDALHDTDLYVRVHAAQCLERMGPRAQSAGPALVHALLDPTLASQAAASLGRIGYLEAESALVGRLSSPVTPHELRVACAAALGQLGGTRSTATLLEIMNAASEPLDLQQVAASAIVQLGAGDQSAGFLLAALQNPDADQPSAEQQLELWLRGRDDEASQTLLSAWESETTPKGTIPTAAQARARRATRHALVEQAWSSLPNLR